MTTAGYAHLDSTTGKLLSSESVAPDSAMQVLSTATGIDGTVATTTNLYTVPNGKQAVIYGAVFRITAAAALIAVATAGVGVAAGEDDIISPIVLTGLNAVNLSKLAQPDLTDAYYVAQAADVIKLGIDVAFTAGTATLSVDLIGYLI